MGLGIGLLAAAAIALSPSVPSLIPLGVEVVLIAFRTGLHVGTVANRLELQRDGSRWSFNLDGTTNAEAQGVLDTIREARV